MRLTGPPPWSSKAAWASWSGRCAARSPVRVCGLSLRHTLRSLSGAGPPAGCRPQRPWSLPVLHHDQPPTRKSSRGALPILAIPRTDEGWRPSHHTHTEPHRPSCVFVLHALPFVYVRLSAVTASEASRRFSSVCLNTAPRASKALPRRTKGCLPSSSRYPLRCRFSSACSAFLPVKLAALLAPTQLGRFQHPKSNIHHWKNGCVPVRRLHDTPCNCSVDTLQDYNS